MQALWEGKLKILRTLIFDPTSQPHILIPYTGSSIMMVRKLLHIANKKTKELECEVYNHTFVSPEEAV